MGTWEWPLIFFTVLSQISVGIIWILLWVDRKNKLEEPLFKKGVLVSGIFLVVALLASLFHLGHPEAAYRAITHLATSWLSREILFFLLTFACWLYLFGQAYRSTGKRQTPLIMTSVFGLLGIISSSMIYVLPRVPAWDNVSPTLFFLLTALLLGTLVFLILGNKELEGTQKKSLALWTFSCVLLSVILFGLYASFIQVNPQGAATIQAMLFSPIFWLRVLFGWIAPLVLLAYALKSKKVLTPHLLYLIVACVGIGEILGRALFYVSAVGIHITAMF